MFRTDLRTLDGAADRDRHDGDALAPEQRFDELQEDPLGSRGQFGELRVEPDRPAEIERFRPDRVGAVEIHACTRQAKVIRENRITPPRMTNLPVKSETTSRAC